MKSKIAIIAFSIYIVFLCSFANFGAGWLIQAVLYLLLPIAVITTVILILKDNSQTYRELGNREWGYRDKRRSEPGMF